jgi:tetratricopeptide (TPR) repeat protein
MKIGEAKMKLVTKIMMVLATVMMLANVTMAGITNDMAAAKALFGSKDWVAAQAAYEAVLADYPDAAVTALATAQGYVGHSLHAQGKFVEAQAAFEAVIANYPDAAVNALATAQRYVGYALRDQGKHAEAQAAFEAVFSNYPDAAVGTLAIAQYHAAHMLSRQGKKAEANAAFIKAAFDYGFVVLAHQKTCFKAIDWYTLGNDASVAYLQNLLLVVPATEANAEFLGEVKSKLEVLK